MRIIDRYLIKQFLLTFLFSLLALYFIFLIVDMLENLDDFLDANVQIWIIIKYYIYFFPEILKLLIPVAMLLSTLFSVGRMSNLNEITAIKTGGISLYRFMLPLLILSIIISLSHLYFNGWIVPLANKEKIEIQQEFIKKNRMGGPLYNLYFRIDPLSNLSMQSYNSSKMEGYRVGIDYFTDDDKPRIIKTIRANVIKWNQDKSNWTLLEVKEFIFSNGVITKFSNIDSLSFSLSITHDKLIKLKQTTKEMTFDELEEYLDLMKKGGRNVDKEYTDLYGQYAFPFANIIVILFGVPFASVKKKGGIAIQIGAALVISFTYLIFTKVSQAIVLSYGIDPFISAWFANIVFLFLGLITIIKTRT